jgi:hypothetical protein
MGSEWRFPCRVATGGGDETRGRGRERERERSESEAKERERGSERESAALSLVGSEVLDEKKKLRLTLTL